MASLVLHESSSLECSEAPQLGEIEQMKIRLPYDILVGTENPTPLSASCPVSPS